MKRKDILMILIPSFIFVIFWIIFSVHHAVSTPTISQAETIQINPISPAFDTKTIAALKKRESVTPIYEIQGSSASTQTGSSNTANSTQISTGSATQASSGGILR